VASKNGTTKRPSPVPESPEPKRQRRATKPAKLREESDASDFSAEDVKPKKGKKAAARRKAKSELESDEEPSLKESSSPERKRKRESKDESDDAKDSLVGLDHGEDQKNGAVAEHATGEEDGQATEPVAEEEEYSDVIDEPIPKRRKKKDKSSTSSKGTKSTKSTTAAKKTSAAAAAAAAATPDDPDEAEIKKLQSQLSKCGIRKLWHNELKAYGEDARAKIRHLKKMLSDAGMDGRFSEAKAREIREMRELLADAEAAQEMNALWGMESGARPSRGKAKRKSMKEDSEESDEEGGGSGGAKEKGKTGNGGDDGGGDDDEEEEEEEENTFAARRRRAQADLAFLGDDSDDSSD
jgi:hypothetical protein